METKTHFWGGDAHVTRDEYEFLKGYELNFYWADVHNYSPRIPPADLERMKEITKRFFPDRYYCTTCNSALNMVKDCGSIWANSYDIIHFKNEDEKAFREKIEKSKQNLNSQNENTDNQTIKKTETKKVADKSNKKVKK